MSWVWVDEKPVWMGTGPADEDIITSVKEYVEFERFEMALRDQRKGVLKRFSMGRQNDVYGSTTIPYSRKKDEDAEHLRG